MNRDPEQAFLEVVRGNEARLWKVCRLFERDDEARKDLFQEILVQLWRAFPSYAGRASVGTWLYRVALNTALSHRRRKAARRESPLEVPDEIASGEPRADEVMESTHRRAQLHAAIRRLGAIDRMLVVMYLDERSYAEIADVLGMSVDNVGVRLHRIRKQLTSLVAEEAK